MINEDLCKRFDKLTSDRTTVQSMWDVIERYCTPYRGRMFQDQKSEHSIEWFTSARESYDSTASTSHQNLAASLHGSLTSPSIRWFDMRFRQDKLNKNKPARKWLQTAGDQVHYALQDSNFNLEVNETYQDLAGYGTAFITLEPADGPEKFNGLQFSSVPLKEAFFEQDNRGLCLRFYRLLEWTPQQILAKFGDDVPEKITKMDEDGKTDKLRVLFCVMPNGNKIPNVGKKLAAGKQPFEGRYMLKDGCEQLGQPVPYYEMPVFVPRWRKTSSSIWGNSPAMFALGDILSLNEARKMQLIASEKLIDPPIFAEERALVADLSLKAATLNVVRDIDGIKPFETRGQIMVSDHMIEQLQSAVRSYFFTDQINYPNPQNQPMTATEAQIRYELMQRLLGPTLGRLQNDLLTPIVQRTFRMLARAGVIEAPPQSVLNADAQFDVEYLGALVRAQRTDQAASIERLVGGIAAMAEVKPGMLDYIDDGEVVLHLGMDLNVPASIIRDEDEVQAYQLKQQAIMQRQQEAATQQQEGEARNANAAAQQQEQVNAETQQP